MTSVRSRLALMSAVLLPATFALAQEQAATPGPQAGPTGPAPEAWHAAINPYAAYTFDADFDGGNMSMSVTRAGLAVNGRVPMSHEWDFDLGIIGEYSNYQFTNRYPGVPDFSLDLLDVQLAPGVSYKLSDKWSVFGGALIEASGATGADVDQAAMYGGYVGFKHKVSEHLSYTVGVGGRTQIEDDGQFFPLLGIDWDINSSLNFSISGSAGGAQVRLSQSLVYDLAVSLVTGYEGRQYRLDHDFAISDGVFRDTRIPLGVELAWRPTPYFAMRGSVGYVVWDQIEFDDSNGHRLSKDHPDPAPYVGLSANWQF